MLCCAKCKNVDWRLAEIALRCKGRPIACHNMHCPLCSAGYARGERDPAQGLNGFAIDRKKRTNGSQIYVRSWKSLRSSKPWRSNDKDYTGEQITDVRSISCLTIESLREVTATRPPFDCLTAIISPHHPDEALHIVNLTKSSFFPLWQSEVLVSSDNQLCNSASTKKWASASSSRWP